jgi:uncharacterized membrane protein YbaN (DUF454 family)
MPAGVRERGAQTGIVAGLTFAAGSGRLRTALPVAAVLGVVVVVYSSLGAVTTGHAWAAALAMAFVAFTTSVMTAARPVGLLVGMVASYAYWLVTAVGVLRHTLVPGAAADVGVLGVLGLVVGLLLVALRALGEQLRRLAPPPTAERPLRRPSSARSSRRCAPSTATLATASAAPSPSASRCSPSRRWPRTTRSG